MTSPDQTSCPFFLPSSCYSGECTKQKVNTWHSVAYHSVYSRCVCELIRVRRRSRWRLRRYSVLGCTEPLAWRGMQGNRVDIGTGGSLIHQYRRSETEANIGDLEEGGKANYSHYSQVQQGSVLRGLRRTPPCMRRYRISSAWDLQTACVFSLRQKRLCSVDSS